jgi:hypothetical protein
MFCNMFLIFLNMLCNILLDLQYTYGFSSCLMGKRWMVIARLGIGYALNNPSFWFT